MQLRLQLRSTMSKDFDDVKALLGASRVLVGVDSHSTAWRDYLAFVDEQIYDGLLGICLNLRHSIQSQVRE